MGKKSVMKEIREICHAWIESFKPVEENDIVPEYLYGILKERYHMNSIARIAEIFSRNIGPGLTYSTKITVKDHPHDVLRSQRLIKNGHGFVETVCRNRDSNIASSDVYDIAITIHCIDINDKYWTIRFDVHTEYPTVYKNHQLVMDIAHLLAKGILDANEEFTKCFKILPDINSNISYYHSGKKVQEEIVTETTKTFVVDA